MSRSRIIFARLTSFTLCTPVVLNRFNSSLSDSLSRMFACLPLKCHILTGSTTNIKIYGFRCYNVVLNVSQWLNEPYFPGFADY